MKPSSRIRLAAMRIGDCAQRGFTLIELMVTVAIALFLLGGLLVVVQNVRQAYINEQALAQLQDEQRFALTVLADVIQAGGYFPDPVAWQPATSLPAIGSWAAGQAYQGSTVNASDAINIRYRTAQGDSVILCDGSTNTTLAPTGVFTNLFTIGGLNNQQLLCTLNGAANPVAIANGVQSMTILYGVKRAATPVDYNVDTYLSWGQMGPSDWQNVSSVRVILSFNNPLYNSKHTTLAPQFITFERVIEVMSRAGLHT
jgi:type IV pilus assembly protein PilW